MNFSTMDTRNHRVFRKESISLILTTVTVGWRLMKNQPMTGRCTMTILLIIGSLFTLLTLMILGLLIVWAGVSNIPDKF